MRVSLRTYDPFEEDRGVTQVRGSLADWKREHEVDVVLLRPHPAEFSLYYER